MADFTDHPLDELRDFAEMAVTVAAAWDVGLFDFLARAPGDADSIASALDLSPRGVAILLPVLEELKVIEGADDGLLHLTASGRRIAESGSGLPLWLGNLRAWTRLPESLRTGRPLEAEDGSNGVGGGVAEEEEALTRYMAGMAAAPPERVRRVVEHCLARCPDARTALDLGGGPGHIARAFVEAGLEVTLMDTPETVGFVREAYGLGKVDRLRLVRGDFIEDPLPEGPFDIVLLSNILHIYPPETNRALLRKVAGVTAPGGVAAIGEFVRERSRRAARFAVVMLLRTDGGDTYSEAEFGGWLEEAGFARVEVADVDEDRQLVSGLRAG